MDEVDGRCRPTDSLYFYSSQPRAVSFGRYRCPNDNDDEDGSPVRYGNIMYDRRIVRGSNYAREVLTQRGCPGFSMAARKPRPKLMHRSREVKSWSHLTEGEPRIRTPVPVPGRKHFISQTEQLAKEFQHLAETANASSQTDPFLDDIPKPFMRAAKSGKDRETQIHPEELFDFDLEMAAPLAVLVSNVAEQSLREVMEEEELAELCEQQNAYAENRNAERAEEERLEEKERKHSLEKEKRMKEKAEHLELEKETLDKVASTAFASSYMSSLVPHVIKVLASNNYFFDPVERAIEFNFLPRLMSTTMGHLQLEVTARTVIDRLIRQVQTDRDQGLSYFEMLALDSQDLIHM